jgi:hypothetical protein
MRFQLRINGTYGQQLLALLVRVLLGGYLLQVQSNLSSNWSVI